MDIGFTIMAYLPSLTDGIIFIVDGGILMSDCRNIGIEIGGSFYSPERYSMRQNRHDVMKKDLP